MLDDGAYLALKVCCSSLSSQRFRRYIYIHIYHFLFREDVEFYFLSSPSDSHSEIPMYV